MLSPNNPAGVLSALQAFDFIDCERTHAYSRLIDAELSRYLKEFNWDSLPWGDADPDCNREMDAQRRQTRGATNVTGQMAFCWGNPLSAFYHDEKLLKHVKARLEAFAENQLEGEIVFPPRDPAPKPRRENLGLAWNIEPLVMAANWIDVELDDEARSRIRRMVRRAADLLMALPCDERNNRGVVRCAVLALLGRYLADWNLIEAAKRDFHQKPVGIFGSNGQINEGPGPDGNYSGTSYVYAYLYRLYSGDETVDRGVAEGARWYSWVSDSFGAPLYMGSATRIAVVDPTKVADFLPGMERYADRYPHLNWEIERKYLRSLDAPIPLHIVNPLIYGLFEHNGETGVEDPDWFASRNIPSYNNTVGAEFRVEDEGTDSLYVVMRRQDNHTAISMLGRFPYKGLQSWNYRLEPPVLWPTVSHASATRAFGVDTARMRISGSKFTDRQWHEGSGEGEDKLPNVLVTRTEEVMQHYLQTDTTLLYLSSSPLTDRTDRFVMCRERCGEPILEDGVIRYDERQGRMFFAGAQPEVKKLSNATHFTFKPTGRTALYAFSNESFELLDFDVDGSFLRFRDDTGTYRLDYETLFFGEDDLAPIGDKGLGVLFLSPKARLKIQREESRD